MAEVLETPVKEVSTTTKVEIEDLSSAIAQSVERGIGERVRCSRVYGNKYRCNWWGRGDVDGVGGRIVRSRFLRVTRTPDGLMIEDLTR